MRRVWALIAVLPLVFVALFSAPYASSATITSKTISDEGPPLTLIFVEGELMSGDEKQFRNFAVTTDAAVVLLSSPGGDLVAGIEIGNAIRLKRFATLVPEGFHCASACALAWLAGSPRMMAAGSTVGFHAAFRVDDDLRVPDASANAVVGAYLNQLGLPTSAIIYVTEALPADIRWLTFDDAERIGIEVKKFEIQDVEQRVVERPETEPRDPLPAGRTEDWTSHGVWIQIVSRPISEEAIRLATNYGNKLAKDASVFLYDNGWYGVVLGPYPPELAYASRVRLLESASIPRDSLITRGDRFTALIWGRGVVENVDSSDEADQALEATRSYFEHSSMPNAEALAFAERTYASELLYFGKWASKADVLRDKADFVFRWPDRKYTVRSDGLNAACESSGGCTVEGVVDWWAYSPAQDKTSFGSAGFRLIFSVLKPITIVLDESNVLSRRIVSGRVVTEPAANGGSETYNVGDIAANDALNVRAGPGDRPPPSGPVAMLV